MPDHLFAYGTLQPGLAPAVVRPAVDRLTLVGPGTTPGRVYDLGSYPGAKFGGDGLVHGRVLRLPPDGADAVMDALDRYEGAPTLYRRRTVSVTTADGSIRCWAYAYARPIGATDRRTASGRFAPETSP